ncbi:transmembrane protein 106C [Patagioenas fasciata monilis]|uniref:Transmembrane protein 106C n=1 Tax=Patagioenas fasciata monilis TaxID=372326 RepID=A0A1V4JI98_PATFA|nr:transmembrane protein 106C [Patagioenas fasciata monilis]
MRQSDAGGSRGGESGGGVAKRPKAEDGDEDGLDSRDRVEDIAKFPYVEFTGQDSITCPTCQGTGCIPTEQVNELVALIPYSDQRLRPQRTKLYVLLSVLLCLLVSGLVVFFLFPHSVLVDDDGIKVVQVWFDKKNSVVILAITATLRIKNSNFYSVTVTSLTSQVQYMNTVVGTQQISSVSSIQPLSDKLVNFTVKAELGGPFSYLYFFCTFPKVKVHNIVIFMRTSVKLSYIGHATQSSLERYHYVDCSTNSTAAPDARPRRSLAPQDAAEATMEP